MNPFTQNQNKTIFGVDNPIPILIGQELSYEFSFQSKNEEERLRHYETWRKSVQLFNRSDRLAFGPYPFPLLNSSLKALIFEEEEHSGIPHMMAQTPIARVPSVSHLGYLL